MLEFRILGSLEVLDDDRMIELGGARQRAVLAILLLQRGETVSVDRIVDLMWSERPPATAVKTVQVYVSHLRRALVEDVIVSSKHGYALAVDAERVDALRFERLLQDGRAALSDDDPARAAELLRSALALWRGPVLGDLAYEPFVEDEATRLEELRLEAVEERIEADLGRGRHVELVAELGGLVREHPLRERLRAQHMLALYQSGRQADALESFRDARRTLVNELGLEPGRELRELEQAILAHDHALDAPRGGRPRPPPADRRRALALIAAGAALASAAIIAVAIALGGSDSSSVAIAPDSVAVIDPQSDLVVADVPVGVRPEAVAADERSVWVANAADATVSQIDIGTRRVAATIAPDVGVEALAAGAGSAWIADASRGRIVRLAADLGTVAASVSFPTTSAGPRAPSAAALGMDALWVASANTAAVYRIDSESGRLDARIDVGNEPAGVAVANGAVWVTDDVENNVRRLMPVGGGAVTDTIPLGNGSGPIAAGEAAIWVVNSRDDTVSRIDPTTRSVEALIKVGRLPTGIAVGAGAVWVANSLSGTVSRIDPATNRVTTTIDVGGAPSSVAAAGGRVWVSIQEAPPPRAPTGGPSVARVVMESDPGTTGPPSLSETHLLHATCARLMTMASRSGSGAAELVPELAVAAPAVSAGGRRYTFRIRRGYRFSPPSGAPVTAAAFQRAIERVARSPLDAYPVEDIAGVAAYRARRAGTVAGVSVRGDRLTIRLKHPSSDLPARMATFGLCAVPPDTPQRPRSLDRVATAGPYYVSVVAPKKRLVLRRNPGYRGPRPHRLDEIEVTIGVPLARAVKQVEAGHADYVARVPADSQARLIRLYGLGSAAAAAGRQRYFAEREPIVSGYAFNTHRRLFASADMRRAVNYALDRRALARHQIPESLAGRPTDQLTPPGWPGFRDATIYPLGGPDLATARRLAGPGRRRAVLYTCNAPQCLAAAEIVRANLAAIGIGVETRVFSFREMFRRIEDPREPYDLAQWGWIGDIPDASGFVDDMFQYFLPSTGFLDRTQLGRRTRAASRLAGTARLQAYAALDRDITARAAPFAVAVSGVSTDFFSARMGCQVEHPIYGIDLAALCVRK